MVNDVALFVKEKEDEGKTLYIVKINTSSAGQQSILATERGREGAIAMSSTDREYDVGMTGTLINVLQFDPGNSVHTSFQGAATLHSFTMPGAIVMQTRTS